MSYLTPLNVDLLLRILDTRVDLNMAYNIEVLLYCILIGFLSGPNFAIETAKMDHL